MSEGLNRATLIGNLGEDPVLRYTQSHTAVLNIRMATTTGYYDDTKRERVERTEWHTVIVWGKRAEALSKFLVKGARVYVEGELQTRSYEARDGGGKRYSTEVKASNILLMGGRRPANAAAPDNEGDDVPQGDEKGSDDDIPF